MFFFVFLFFLLILNVFLFTTKKFREDDGGFNCVFVEMFHPPKRRGKIR